MEGVEDLKVESYFREGIKKEYLLELDIYLYQ